MHGMCPSGVAQARYAFSADAVHWTNSPRQAYGYRVAFDDGSEQIFERVERPQLGFSNTSRNASTGTFGVHLTLCAVVPGNSCRR